jgi:hypothetical protein
MICPECQKDCVESDICPQCESCLMMCCECELLWDHRNYEEEEEEEIDDDE